MDLYYPILTLLPIVLPYFTWRIRLRSPNSPLLQNSTEAEPPPRGGEDNFPLPTWVASLRVGWDGSQWNPLNIYWRSIELLLKILETCPETWWAIKIAWTCPSQLGSSPTEIWNLDQIEETDGACPKRELNRIEGVEVTKLLPGIHKQWFKSRTTQWSIRFWVFFSTEPSLAKCVGNTFRISVTR